MFSARICFRLIVKGGGSNYGAFLSAEEGSIYWKLHQVRTVRT